MKHIKPIFYTNETRKAGLLKQYGAHASDRVPPGRLRISVSDAILMAAAGPLTIVDGLRPSYGRRYRQWLYDLQNEYDKHVFRDGQAAALGWLMKQVCDPKLPDLRRGKSADNDEVLLEKLTHLKRALAPVFRETKGNPQTRLKRVASIVSEVLGHLWKPPHTMTGKEPLMAFCYDVLGVSAARVSQAHARFNRATYQLFENAITGFEMLLAARGDDGNLPALIAEARRYQQVIRIRPPKPRSLRAKK